MKLQMCWYQCFNNDLDQGQKLREIFLSGNKNSALEGRMLILSRVLDSKHGNAMYFIWRTVYR